MIRTSPEERALTVLAATFEHHDKGATSRALRAAQRSLQAMRGTNQRLFRENAALRRAGLEPAA